MEPFACDGRPRARLTERRRGVRQAAAVGVPHDKWGERPLLCAVAKPGAVLAEGDVLAALRTKGLPSWMLPDAVILLDELPVRMAPSAAALRPG